MTKYWLMKTEPNTYSIDDLRRDRKTLWEGVRNYQARNFMTQAMKVGDLVLFYHSSCDPPGIVGVARISRKAVADISAFDRKSPYFDKKATRESPIWFCVEVEFVKKFLTIISLSELKKHRKLAKMKVLVKGSRLSIQPVSSDEFHFICTLTKGKQMAEVKIYTKKVCPYCVAAKNLFQKKNVPFQEYDVEKHEGLYEKLKSETGMRTVPQIFIDGKLIGGYTELSQLDNQGQLDVLLTS